MRAPRSLAVTVLLLALTASPGRTSDLPQAAALDTRPNFVIIVTDDQRWDTIGRCEPTLNGLDLAAGSASCMPNLQRDLMPRGVTFQRGYVTTSLCCPSRSSILTGRYARNTGVRGNNDYQLFDESSTLATWMASAGYRTGLVGKYLNGYGLPPTPPNHVPPGWDTWHAYLEGSVGSYYTSYDLLEKTPGTAAVKRHYEVPASQSITGACAVGNVYGTDLLCRRSLEFIASAGETPFLLVFAPRSPHMPAIAAKRHKSLYTSNGLPAYPNRNVLPGPGTWIRRSTPLSADRLKQLDSQWRTMLRTHRAVDDAIRQLHAQLAADGRLSRTVWIYVSDNSFARAEHRWEEKRCEFEECHRIPYVAVCPAAICPSPRAGVVDANHLVLNIDLAPTIADLAGVTPPAEVDGVSLRPLLGGVPGPWRDEFVIENWDRPAPEMVGLMGYADDGHLYKYLELASSLVQRELFDLTADPWELVNRAEDPAYAGIRNEFDARLAAALAD